MVLENSGWLASPAARVHRGKGTPIQGPPLWSKWLHACLSRSGHGFDHRSGQVSWVRFFQGFSSPVRQMSGSFRSQGPRISFGHHYNPPSFITGANDLRCWRALKPEIYIHTQYRPWMPTGDVGARVHIFTAMVLGWGKVASPTLGCLYPQGYPPVLIL